MSIDMGTELSFHGFHQETATFRAASGVTVGSLVALSASAEVSPAADGGDFIGVCVSLRGKLAGVQLCGAVMLEYTGAAPAVGRSGLASAGENKVKAAADGTKHLVLVLNEAKNTCTVLL